MLRSSGMFFLIDLPVCRTRAAWRNSAVIGFPVARIMEREGSWKACVTHPIGPMCKLPMRDDSPELTHGGRPSIISGPLVLDLALVASSAVVVKIVDPVFRPRFGERPRES